MRLVAAAWIAAVPVLLATAVVRAEPPAGPVGGDKPVPAPAETPGEDVYADSLVLDTGRSTPKEKQPNAVVFDLHGEFQVRYRAMSDLPLTAPLSAPTVKTLGQNQYLYTWVRLTPVIHYRDKFSIIAQADVPRGLVVGDTTRFVGAAREPLDDQNSWYQFHPRYLYLEYESPIGLFRIGQQGSHWGMGILANDGDHPTLFGDYSGGSLTERFLFATTPLGVGTPLAIAVAGDFVFEDPTASVIKYGDRAFEGVLAILYGHATDPRARSAGGKPTDPPSRPGERSKAAGEIGLYGVIRHQERDQRATDRYTPYSDHLTVAVVDLTAKFHAPVAGARAFVYGEMEGAGIFGSTDYVRGNFVEQPDPTTPHRDERVATYGGAATLGAVKVAGKGDDAWGSIAAEIEGGYASGDANPYDGVTKRFTFDPNHNVGLVLFKQVMAWKTARAATIAADPNIVARAAPGLELLPSNGGVFGAAYLNPRAVFRPIKQLDLKVGTVIASTSSDFVDPYHFGALGSPRNYDGGDPKKHDLGLELDAGFDARVPAAKNITVQFGAEGGVLFPGHAFDDAAGRGLPNQYLLNTKLGMQF